MKHFKIEEFDCPCCGDNLMSEFFLSRLDMARGISGTPYIINSGYRCSIHNKKVGSTSSNHTRGMAADIRVKTKAARGKILRGLYLSGFKRVGIYEDYVHADLNTGPESCWLKKGGNYV